MIMFDENSPLRKLWEGLQDVVAVDRRAAERSGLEASTVAKFRTGKIRLSYLNFERLARACGFDVAIVNKWTGKVYVNAETLAEKDEWQIEPFEAPPLITGLAPAPPDDNEA